MSDTRRLESLSPAQARQIDQACDRFEQAWQQGERPDLETYVQDAPSALQSALLRQLLLLDWDYRQRAGELPQTVDYEAQFPEHGDLIASVSRELAQPNGELTWLRSVDAYLPPVPEPGFPRPDTAHAMKTGAEPFVGRYELVREIGHGGIGVVFRGRDSLLGRELAIKVLRETYRNQPEARRRFIAEARIGSRLQHPAIVPVYELGWFSEQRPYITMRLVEGRTLAGLLRDRSHVNQDLPRWLGIFVQVCQAMAYAHAQRIVHRDLKPANIMVGKFGEVQVMDWGFAKQLPAADETLFEDDDLPPLRREVGPAEPGGALTATQYGIVMGTPAYMPPEQARGERDLIDPRADVFALGAILCEILTGNAPYVGSDAEEVCRQAARGDLQSAYDRLEACGVEESLRGLARRCLAVNRNARPPDAGVLAQEIAVYLASAQERLKQAQLDRVAAEARAQEAAAKAKAERRSRRLTVALSAAAAVFVLTVGTVWWWREHVRFMESARRAVVDGKVDAALAEASGHMQRRDWPQARAAAVRARELLESSGNVSGKPAVDNMLNDLDLLTQIEENRRLQGVYDVVSERFTRGKALPHYKDAFARYGIVVGMDPAQAATRIAQRPGPVREAILAGLDNWWQVALSRDAATHAWLGAVLQRADADDWRTLVRGAITQRNHRLLAALARCAEAEFQPPAAITSLTWALLEFKAYDEAVTLLRPAQRRHPGDYWINLDLAQALMLRQPPDYAEALRFYSVVRVLRPEANIYLNLGVLHARQQDWYSVINVSRRALELTPANEPVLRAQAYTNLGHGLVSAGTLSQAIEAYRQAVALAPHEPNAHAGLGYALFRAGQFDHAIAAYEQALHLVRPAAQPGAGEPEATHLRPEEVAKIHVALGDARLARNQFDLARLAYDQAIQLHPGSAHAHCKRGNLLLQTKRFDEAIVAYEEAARLDPTMEAAHSNLGVAWHRKGDPVRAIPACARGVALNDRSTQGHYNLGLGLHAAGDFDQAEVHYRRALQLDANLPEVRCALGELLLRRGAFTEGLEQIAEGHRLGSTKPGWRYASAEWLRKAERLVSQEAKLARIQAGSERPANADEKLQLALVSDLKGMPRAAACLFLVAFTDKPALAASLHYGHRYQAACCAARVGVGPGLGLPLWDTVEQACWRRQALEWLRADLTHWSRRLEQSPEARLQVRHALQRWQKEKVLACLREPEHLARLPRAEQADWLRFWAEVQALLVQSLAGTNS